MCQPEILLSPFPLEAVCLSASALLLLPFLSLHKAIPNNHIWSAYSLLSLFLFPIWAFMTCVAMFHTLQSCTTARIHSLNIRTFL